MSDLVERVARAIKSAWDTSMTAEAEASGGHLDYAPGPWQEWVLEAKAAIAVIAAMQADAEPVAWMYTHKGMERRHVTISRDCDPEYVTGSLGYVETPLYAHPIDLPAEREAAARRYRHKVRGTEYVLIGTASLQSAHPIMEGALLEIYRGDDGKLWARPANEFHDGRFEAIDPAQFREAKHD